MPPLLCHQRSWTQDGCGTQDCLTCSYKVQLPAGWWDSGESNVFLIDLDDTMPHTAFNRYYNSYIRLLEDKQERMYYIYNSSNWTRIQQWLMDDLNIPSTRVNKATACCDDMLRLNLTSIEPYQIVPFGAWNALRALQTAPRDPSYGIRDERMCSILGMSKVIV